MSILLILAILFPLINISPNIAEAYINDPADLGEKGKSFNNKTLWFKDYWEAKTNYDINGNITNRRTLGKTGAFSEAGGKDWRNFVASGTRDSWTDAFGGNRTFVSSQASLNNLKRDSPSQTFLRYYIRDIAEASGGSIPSYDSTKGEFDVIISRKPSGGIYISYPITLGKPTDITVTPSSFVVSSKYHGINWIFKVNGSTVRTGNSSSNSVSQKFQHTFSSAGTYTLTLEMTDKVGRTSSKTETITLQDKTAPPPPSPPPSTDRPTANFEMPFSALTMEEVTMTNTSTAPSGRWITYSEFTISPSTDVIGSFSGLGLFNGKATYSNTGSYDVTLKVWDNTDATDSITKTILITSLPEPPPATPPTARILAPNEAIQGDDVNIRSGSYDSDGFIVSHNWSVTPSTNKVGTIAGEDSTVYWDKEGDYSISLSVTDNDGLMDSTNHTIKILPAIPRAYFEWEGIPKENRRMAFDATKSYTPSRYPILWDEAEWQFVPPTGVSVDTIKIRTSSDLTKREVTFKGHGDYKVRLRVKNTAGHWSEWFEQTIQIYPDQAPVADFYVVKLATRDETGQATIYLQDQSFSPDGDTINKRIWHYRYDSNNDGNFSDEPWVLLSDGNELNPTLNTNQVGKYQFKLYIEEDIGTNILAEFITPADIRKGDTTNKPVEEITVEVINLAPIVSFEVDEKKKADIVFSVGEVSSGKTNDLQTKIIQYIATKLAGANIDYKISSVETSTIKADDQNALSIFSNWQSIDIPSGANSSGAWIVDGNKVVANDFFSPAKAWYDPSEKAMATTDAEISFKWGLRSDAHSFDHGETGFIFRMKDTRNYYAYIMDNHSACGNIPHDYREAIVKVVDGNFQVIATQPFPSFYAGQSHDITIRMEGSNIKVYRDNNLRFDINDSTYPKGSYGFYVWYQNGAYFGDISIKSEAIKTLDEVMKEPQWRDGAMRFIADIRDTRIKELFGTEIITKQNLKPVSSTFAGSFGTSSGGNTASGGSISGSDYINAKTRTIDLGTPIPKSEIEKIIFEANTGNGDTTLRQIDFHVSEDNWSWYSVGSGYATSSTYTNTTVLGKNISINNIRYIRAVNSFCLDNLIVKIHKPSPDAVNEEKMANFISELIGKNIDFSGLGTTTNKNDYEKIISMNDGNGIFIDNNNMDTALNTYGDYIVNKILSSKKTNIQYILLNEEVEYKTFYSDIENDPEFARRWKYTHDDMYYDNSLGLANFHDQFISAPISSFAQTGKYEVIFQARDNPKNDNRFSNYRLWSDMPTDNLVLIVHRKPIAEFSIQMTDVGMSYNLGFTSSSYDLDHESKPDKGITESVWRWKKVEDTAWNDGLPTNIPKGENYLISLKVKDLEGVWSDENVKTIATSANMPPVAQFTVSPNPLLINNSLSVNDTSYDPNGDFIVAREWRYQRPDGTWSSILGSFPTNVYNQLGVYRIELRVQDQHGLWSDYYYQSVTVMGLPIANFKIHEAIPETSTTILNKAPNRIDIKFTDYSWDTDGRPIVAWEWQHRKVGDSTWTNGRFGELQSAKTIGGNKAEFINIYGVPEGSYEIRLRVRAEGKPYWSAWHMETLEVVPRVTIIGGYEGEPIVGNTITLRGVTNLEATSATVEFLGELRNLNLVSTTVNSKIWETNFTIPLTITESGERNATFTAYSMYSYLGDIAIDVVPINIIALMLIDFRVVDIVNHLEYNYPLYKDNLPVDYRSGYYTTFRINARGNPNRVESRVGVGGVYDKTVDMTLIENLGLETVWEGRYYSPARLPTGTLISMELEGFRGVVSYNYNAREPFHGNVLRVNGTALSDARINRTN